MLYRWKLILLLIVLVSFSGCAVELMGEKSKLDELLFPVGMVLHPDGRYLYSINSNFDLDYRSSDGGVLVVIDTESGEHGEILSDQSKRIGSFGGEIKLNADASRGYFVSRGDDSLYWFNIEDGGRRVVCPLEKKADSQSLKACRIELGEDPTGLDITRSYREDENGSRVEFDLLMVAHLNEARVSALTVRSGEDGLPVFSSSYAALVHGGGEVLHHRGERFFVTGRMASNLEVVSPSLNSSGEVLGLQISDRLLVPTPYQFYQGRGMCMDGGKSRLFMLTKSPHQVIRFGINGLGDGKNSGGKRSIDGLTLLPRDPSKLALIGEGSEEILYITSYREDSLLLVEPDSMALIRSIEIGDAPFGLLYDKVRKRVLVSHFRSNEIWIFDVSQARDPKVVKVIKKG